MKQRITSLFAIGMLALALGTTTANANEIATTVKVNPSLNTQNYLPKKLIVAGNVEVTLVQDIDSKKLYTNDNNAKVRVYTTDNAIYVSTKKNTDKAKITLYVGNIFRIDASGNALINTKNTLNVQNLQLILQDEAVANIKSNTESLYAKMDSESKLSLCGSTQLYTLSTNELATIDSQNFQALKTEVEKRNSAELAQAK
jgi:hypothetical protein